ncbi:cyclic nucleotide-binding domain-containing protein [Azospirillum griseum]|uniref:histidine kinase n=1 Tax=Azospirillum griseum TaxID=2496639 RepID=A0A3S0KCH3_9PROT|nr:cyclic nucleotide-binding domain-containing protein [Azospirillum griseum]RTR22053.1 cyclic nucleotide-binding domain-containing protein [Azospirillum griseum]
MPTVCGALDGISLFDSFTSAERAAVEAQGRVFDAPPGHVLMSEGTEAQSLYVLLSGTVRVVRSDGVGGQVEVGFRQAGECFGEMALVDGGTRSASIIAATPVTVFELERDLFLSLISPSPDLLAKLLRELSRMIRDVSERVVREDLERRARLAESALARHRAITQAVTGLAHELNTPLGVCVTAASHLQDLAVMGMEDVREPTALLQSNLARAVELVEAFTAIAACQHTGPLDALDAREVVEHAIALFRAQRPDCGLSITVLPGDPCPWLGHAAHLDRVLHHLIDNVHAHAHPDGGGSLTIALDPAALEGKRAWRITLRDDGVGIAAAHLPVLTDAFFTTARGRGHKGLGLAVVFNTVTGPMGGRLSIDSQPGQGTRVTLVIPQDL